MHSPVVSVVVPVYNRLEFLQEAVESVLSQSYPRVELVIYDDGSDQPEIHAYYEGLPSSVKVIRGSHVGLIATSRNRGSDHATGDYIAFLDSDDIWHQEKITRQLEGLRRSGSRWSYARFGMVNERSQLIGIPTESDGPPQQGWILEGLLTTNAQVAMNTVVIERSLFDDVAGFDESPELDAREDYDLLMRIAEREPVDFTDEVLGWVRQHDNRTTSAVDDGWARSAVLYERFLRRNDDPRLRRIAEKRLAYHLVRSLRTQPHEWRNSAWWAQWIKVLRLIVK